MITMLRVVGCVIASVSLMAAWAACAAYAEGLPESLLKEVRSPEILPKGRYILAKTWEAEGKEAGHGDGRVVADPEAEGGSAWEALPEAADDYLAAKPKSKKSSSGYILYGPYVELPAGNYVAFFRIKFLENPGDEEVAYLDACVESGRENLAAREVSPDDLAKGRYMQVPLGFHYAGGKLECRVRWSGYASLRVDRVTLFRLEGGDLGSLVGKAPQPKPSGLPTDLTPVVEPRPFPDVFPRSSPPAPKLLVMDVRPLRRDWQLCLLTLQGIVNREQPQVYCLFNETDQEWLDRMVKRGWIQGTETITAPKDLLARFRDRIKGVVITDPQLPATKNVATMIAGVKDAVVASPRIAGEMPWPVLDDLRGRWQTSLDAYRWAFDHLWGSLNHHVIACLWPEYFGLRDYLVQHKVFIFWLPGPIDGARKYSRPNEEVRLMEELLAKMPANIPTMGYSWAGKDVGIGEGPGVRLLAEFGKYLVGSVNCSNLSVHSGIRDVKFEQRVPSPPALQKDKIYVSVIISDGDNLPVLTLHNFPQLWKDPLRGRFPLGWTISPSASLLIPDVAEFYYSTATPNDCLLGAVSGVGYTYPDHYGKRFKEADCARVFDGFLDQTRVTMDPMALRSIWIMGITRPDLIRRYAERIPFLEAIFPDYGRKAPNYGEATYPVTRNVGVFHAANNWKEDISHEEQVAGIVSQIRSFTPTERPAFLHLFIWNWGFTLPMIQDILRRLGPEYVAVRPDHMAALYREHLAGHPVLMRLPPSVSGIEGCPLVFSALLYNTTDRLLEARARIASGMGQAAVTPATVAVPPTQAASLEISGIPAGDTIVLECSGPFGAVRSSAACRCIPRREIVGTLPAAAVLRSVKYLEAEQLPHRSGKEEKDPQASNQAVWSAVRGETEPGHIVYGPYAPLPEGRYLALFRLKRTGEGEGVVATLDACVAGGHDSVKRDVRADELPIGEYRCISIEFKHPGGPLETRVLWGGNASLSVDSIMVWEIGAVKGPGPPG